MRRQQILADAPERILRYKLPENKQRMHELIGNENFWKRADWAFVQHAIDRQFWAAVIYQDHYTVYELLERYGHDKITIDIDDMRAINDPDYVMPTNHYRYSVCTGSRVTPLMKATHLGALEVVKFLLRQRVRLETKDTTGMTALMQAAQSGQADCLSLLIENGAQINARYEINGYYPADSGATPAIFAAGNGHLNCLKRLLDAGASPDAVDNCERTALMYAAIHGHSNCLQLLLDRGADAHKKSEDSFFITGKRNALDYAQLQRHETCIRILSSHIFKTKM